MYKEKNWTVVFKKLKGPKNYKHFFKLKNKTIHVVIDALIQGQAKKSQTFEEALVPYFRVLKKTIDLTTFIDVDGFNKMFLKLE